MIDVKTSLEFNKAVMALSAGGFAYAFEKLAPLESISSNLLTTFVIFAFVVSIISAVLVIGRASKLVGLGKDKTDDADFRLMGRVSSFSFLAAAIVLGTHFLLVVWEVL